MTKFDRVAALVTGLGLSPKVRADLFAAMRADLEQNETETDGDHIHAAGDKKNNALTAAEQQNLSYSTRMALACAARAGVQVGPDGISLEDFDRQAAQGKSSVTDRIAAKAMLHNIRMLKS